MTKSHLLDDYSKQFVSAIYHSILLRFLLRLHFHSSRYRGTRPISNKAHSILLSVHGQAANNYVSLRFRYVSLSVDVTLSTPSNTCDAIKNAFFHFSSPIKRGDEISFSTLRHVSLTHVSLDA